MEEAHTDLGVLEAPGFLHLCICQRREGGPGSCSWSPPSTDAFLPLPFLTLPLCPRGGGEQRAPSWWRDCPVEATGVHGHPPGLELVGSGSDCLWARPLGASCPGLLYLTV